LTDEQEAALGTDLHWPISVTPDGRFLLSMTWAHPVRGGDVWSVPLDGSGDPQLLLGTESNEIIPVISPDGNWIAFLCDRTGPYEIFVRPFPDVQSREWQISDGGGFDARWSPRGDEILYRKGWSGLMSVSIGFGPDGQLEPGVPREVFETDFHDAAGSSFALSPDGRRVLVNKPVEVSLQDSTPLSLVTGWGGEVTGRVQSE
jgi:hypothetical protein